MYRLVNLWKRGFYGAAGVISRTAVYQLFSPVFYLPAAHNLRDKAWIGKADPYCESKLILFMTAIPKYRMAPPFSS